MFSHHAALPVSFAHLVAVTRCVSPSDVLFVRFMQWLFGVEAQSRYSDVVCHPEPVLYATDKLEEVYLQVCSQQPARTSFWTVLLYR